MNWMDGFTLVGECPQPTPANRVRTMKTTRFHEQCVVWFLMKKDMTAAITLIIRHVS